MKVSKKFRGSVCAVAGSACWAVSGACAQFLFTGYGAGELWLTCVRMLLAAVLFMGLALLFDRKNLAGILRNVESIQQLLLFAVFGVLFCQTSYMFAISATNAGTATVIQSLGLALIMLYGCVRAHRLPTRRECLALALALAGIFLVCTNGNPAVLVLSYAGIAWGGITAVSLALYTILPGKLLAKWGSSSVTGYAMLIGGALLAVFVQPWNCMVVLDGPGLAALAAVTVVGTLLAYAFYLQGIADIGPVRAGLFGAVEPIAACIISVTWLGTRFTVATLAGFTLIVGMGFVVNAKSASGREDPPGR